MLHCIGGGGLCFFGGIWVPIEHNVAGAEAYLHQGFILIHPLSYAPPKRGHVIEACLTHPPTAKTLPHGSVVLPCTALVHHILLCVFGHTTASNSRLWNSNSVYL